MMLKKAATALRTDILVISENPMTGMNNQTKA